MRKSTNKTDYSAGKQVMSPIWEVEVSNLSQMITWQSYQSLKRPERQSKMHWLGSLNFFLVSAPVVPTVLLLRTIGFIELKGSSE